MKDPKNFWRQTKKKKKGQQPIDSLQKQLNILLPGNHILTEEGANKQKVKAHFSQ